MSKMTLVPGENPVLHSIAEECTNIEEAIQIAKEMLEFLLVEIGEHGYALAAPQIGIPKRIVVFRSGKICINPRITKTYGPDMPPSKFKKPILPNGEGCLSYPGERVVVPRFERIEVEYVDGNGVTTTEKPRGFEAVGFQHELDHLDGVVIVDEPKG